MSFLLTAAVGRASIVPPWIAYAPVPSTAKALRSGGSPRLVWRATLPPWLLGEEVAKWQTRGICLPHPVGDPPPGKLFAPEARQEGRVGAGPDSRTPAARPVRESSPRSIAARGFPLLWVLRSA